MSGSSSYGSCCYADCTNSYSAKSNAIFFKFPNDEARRKKWIANCGNPEVAQLSDRHLRGKRICAIHFPESAFTDPAKKETLSDKAIPNKYTQVKTEPVGSEEPPQETPSKRGQRGRQAVNKPPESPTAAAPAKTRRGSEVSKPQTTADDDKKKSRTGSCCYAECANSAGSSDIALFTFPADEARRKKWITNCGNADVAQLSERNLKAKRICAAHFTDASFTDSSKKDELTEKAVPVKYVKEKNPPELKPEVDAPASPQRKSPTRAESPPRKGRGGRQSTKNVENVAKATPEVKSKPSADAVSTNIQRGVAGKVQSAFGKSLYTLLNGLLYDDEPGPRREKRPFTRPVETPPTPVYANKAPVRLPNGRTIKTEIMEPSEKIPRYQKVPTIRAVGQNKSRTIEQFVNFSHTDQGSFIMQNGAEFTLAEGQEYEVIGESDGHDGQIQVVESGENNEIEIIEVDDQTMAQLTAQNVFFPNSGMSGNIQVTELDPNMGQILKVINPQEAYYQYQ